MRQDPGKKEGAWDVEDEVPPEGKVLGDAATGKQTREAVLQAQTEEGSVHPNNPTM